MPQTGAQTGQTMQSGQMGQMQTGQQGQMGMQEQADLVPQTGQHFEQDLTPELYNALRDFEKVTDVTTWCVDQMIEEGPMMATCIRVCQDIGELADLNARMIARDSIYGLEAAMLFMSVARDGLQEIQRHQNPHCQETVSVINRALDSTQQLLETFGQPQLIQQVERQLQQAHEQFEQTGAQMQEQMGQMGQQGGQMGQQGMGQQGQMGMQQPQQGGQMGQRGMGQQGQMTQREMQGGQMGQQGMQQPQQW